MRRLPKQTSLESAGSNAKVMQKKCKPSDATAEIHMEQEVDGLRFGLARQFYNNVIGVQAQYNLNVRRMDTLLTTPLSVIGL